MFNQMAIKKTLLIFMVFIGIIAIFSIKNVIETNQTIKEVLTKKETILDESQFIFNPIFEKNGSNNELKILVEITSYMNPEILQFNYKEQSLIEFGNIILQPTKWTILEQSKYKVIGQLTFELNKRVEQFKLKLFTYSDHEIHWN